MAGDDPRAVGRATDRPLPGTACLAGPTDPPARSAEQETRRTRIAAVLDAPSGIGTKRPDQSSPHVTSNAAALGEQPWSIMRPDHPSQSRECDRSGVVNIQPGTFCRSSLFIGQPRRRRCLDSCARPCAGAVRRDRAPNPRPATSTAVRAGMFLIRLLGPMPNSLAIRTASPDSRQRRCASAQSCCLSSFVPISCFPTT